MVLRDTSAETRRSAITHYILQNNYASVQDLSQRFGVSRVTVRADLDILEKTGLIKRQHGGAGVLQEELPGTIAFQGRARINQEAKRLIGEAAANLVEDGDSIMIDSSTTGFYVARALRNKHDLRILTNGINTALELLKGSHTIIMVGGMLNERTYGTVGRLGKNMLDGIRVHKAFLGARGVSLKDGLTDSSLLEVELKQMIMEISTQVIAIADSSKFNEVGFSAFAPISRVSVVVTDNGIPQDIKHALEEINIRVMIVEAASTMALNT